MGGFAEALSVSVEAVRRSPSEGGGHCWAGVDIKAPAQA